MILKKGTNRPLISPSFEKIHLRELSRRINYLWNMGNMGNLIGFTVSNMRICVEISEEKKGNKYPNKNAYAQGLFCV